MDVGRPKRLPTHVYGFLTLAKVARATKCVKDTVKYEPGEWNNHKLFASFLNFSAY